MFHLEHASPYLETLQGGGRTNFEYGGLPCGRTLLHVGTNAREPDDWSRAVSAQIRAERAAKDWDQPEMYHQAKMKRSTYIRTETGQRVADVSDVWSIALAVGISASALIARAEDRYRTERGGGRGAETSTPQQVGPSGQEHPDTTPLAPPPDERQTE